MIQNNIIDKEQIQNNKLFYKVWSNIVLFRNIYRYVRLYKKNEKVLFKSRKQLLEYPEREFINCLIYTSCENLEFGDLPIKCVLKEVELTMSNHSSIHGSLIPFGVETLKFPWVDNNRGIETTQISTFPSSLKNLYGIFLGKNIYKTKIKSTKNKKQKINGEKKEKRFIIPPNIESVFLNHSTNISGEDKGEGYIVLLKGLKEITFDYCWYNQNIILRKGDFPDGLTTLAMHGYEIKNILNKDILPSSIKNLSISYGISEFDDNESESEPGTFDVLPPNIEKLKITNYCKIKQDSLLYKCSTLKNLSIFCGEIDSIIEPGSLPPNLTKLSIGCYKHQIKIGIIPFGVKTLKLQLTSDAQSGYNSNTIEIGSIPSSVESLSLNNYIAQPELFPPSLTHLTYTHFNYNDVSSDYSRDELFSFFSLLPNSITSLSLHKTREDLNFKFPNTIKKIDYEATK
ncbi:hypothetical protein RB653_007180 [Dictyostelium firmibasis]|uniref:FNIP repeat-containing protein n=1 Tax=Dictyostelium firmibasis TaxID=79012 RepID=A0AAN7TU51_9MYCE